MITINEHRGRRDRILNAIKGSGIPKEAGVAVLQGAPKEDAHTRFRQYNDMMYLCAIETPHAYLVLDSRDSTCHLFLPYQAPEIREREGALLSASFPDEAIQATGVDAVHGLNELAGYLENVYRIYTPLRAGEGAMQSWDTLQRAHQERISDPWDGQLDRMRRFANLLRERFPMTELHDLSPMLDKLRLLKSETEMQLLRRSGQLAAEGLLAAMRATGPGVMEYELDAEMRYVYLKNGALDVSYRAIVAGGDNAWYGHYNANNKPLQSGDLVLVDCGPDFQYYASDITRMWPVNGAYNKIQQQLYGFIVTYHKTLLRLLRPGVTAEQVRDEAAAEMADFVKSFTFAKPIYAEAAQRALNFPYHLSHPVGMAVHDVGHYRGQVLKPGTVLSVDPQLIVPEERLYIRVEDTVAITEDGIENFTSIAPLELSEIEALINV
jgi:Xaa-Pro aminopeptidase